MSEGFFSRWSRRKQEAGQTQEPVPGVPDAPSHKPVPAQALAVPSTVAAAPATEAEAALPTLQDAQALTPESDFEPFMRSGVGAEVRNAAMKQLFTDPHFNVMDGLDIYIEDYSQSDPMPVGMLQKMASAQFLKLVPSEEAAQPVSPSGEVVAQSPDTSATADPPRHDDPDLQLQPDPSPAGPPAEPGAG